MPIMNTRGNEKLNVQLNIRLPPISNFKTPQKAPNLTNGRMKENQFSFPAHWGVINAIWRADYRTSHSAD